ncbi:MAG: hypothetical protein HGB34_03955 [Candidatus Moranbacteria bacterium]|nr:hypothetical protein [Candidatus Moranbacteria bacterium]NTW76029.1 hypothetical protein [Candidatus Moranbacteria bacterium]
MEIPFFVSGVVYAAGVIEDATPIAEVLANGLSLVLSLVGIFAMLSFCIAGVLYLTAGGDEGRMKRAKGAMTFSIIGVSVCVCALIVVRTVAGMV